MADLGEVLLGAWVAASRIAGPLGRALIARRRRSGREHPTRWPERLGLSADTPPADRPVVWVHAASVGETVSILPLVGRIADQGAFVVLTTVTTTSADVVAGRLPANVVHQFVPVDIASAVGAFLDRWSPRVAVFVESEMWPVALALLARRGTPLVIANARMSDRSFRRWSRVPSIIGALTRRIALCLAQTADDAVRFRALGAVRVETVGNVKLDAKAPEASPQAVAALTAALADRPIVLAASTHPGEEALALQAHRRLAHAHPGLLTILAPRHPARGAEVERLVREQGLSAARRSAGQLPDAATEVYIVDTVGELGSFYRLAPVAFVGGSFGGVGGHNPVEAVHAGTAIVTGPDVSNNRPIFEALVAAGGAVMVADGEALGMAIADLLADPARRARQTTAAAATVAASAGAIDRSLALLAPYLARTGRP